MRATPQHDVPVGFKRCGGCETVRPRDAFVRRASSRDDLYSYCKPCHSRHQREREARDPVGTERRRTRAKARVYNLTPEEYEAIIARGCAVCGTHSVRLGIDHDHASGAIRDALCIRCNAALGQMQDDPALLRAAATYLERHQR